MLSSASMRSGKNGAGWSTPITVTECAVQLHLLADDARVAAEALHPEVVREDHDRRQLRAVVARPRQPAEHRRESHDLEVVAGDEPHVDADGAVVTLQRERPRGVFGDAAERLGAGAEIADLGNGEGDVRAARVRRSTAAGRPADRRRGGAAA